MYPVWLGFRGGKGVATGLGAFLPLAPEAVLAAVIVFALVLAATRYVSLASISAVLALAGFAFALGAPTPTAWAIAFAAALVVFRHRGNLIRLLRGTESRAGRRGT
jgi:glycerol-3-phosphate acyltransferase PlsY